jgi:hypothetical protein
MTASTSKPTANELLEQLTGFDEQKIEARFGAEVLEVEGTKFLRSLVFGNELHQGKSEDEAWNAAQGLTVKLVRDYFASDPEDAMPDEPDSESGKDDSAGDA